MPKLFTFLPFYFFTFLLLFYLVKSFTKHTVAESLRNNGLRINLLYHSKDVLRLILARQHNKHFHIFLAIPSLTFNNSNATIHTTVDSISYLFVVL